jgi:hypothetical protein
MAPPAKTPMTSASPPIPHEKIAQRAYEKWMKGGCNHGRHMQDWIEAEAELRAEASGMKGTMRH